MKSTKRVLVFIARVALVMSLLSITCFADTEAPNAGSESSAVTEAPNDSGTTAVTTAGTTVGTTASEEKDEAKPGDSILWTLIPLGVVLVAVAVCAVIFLGIPKRREKTLKFLRSLKSEWKKISWYSWKQTLKGTAVVVVISVIIAIVVGLLDLGFTKGIDAIMDLVKPLLK